MRKFWLLLLLLPSLRLAAQTVNPHTQVRWPANCGTDGSMVYNFVLNTCVKAGTAANPAGSPSQLQFNAGGIFGGASGITTSDGQSLNVTGTVAASQAVAAFIQSVSCTNGNDNKDYNALQGAINNIQTNAPNGRGTLRIPEGSHCNILPPSTTATEALLVTGPVSLDNHGVLNFQMPLPVTTNVSACSTSNVGLISTATITTAVPNGLVAGWTGYTTGFTGACAALNNMRFTVSATGLSTGGFQFTIPAYIPTPFSGSTAGSVTANMAEIRIEPNGNNLLGVSWANGMLGVVPFPDGPAHNTTLGGDFVVFDCSHNGIPQFTMTNMKFDSTAYGFHTLFMDNGNNASTGGCVIESHFKDLSVGNGMYFQHVGDNNLWDGNGVYGNPGGEAFDAENIVGATNNVLRGMTLESANTIIHLRGGLQWTLRELEVAGGQTNNVPPGTIIGTNPPTTAPLSGPYIWLDGSDWIYNQLNGTLLEDNKIVDNNFPLAIPNLQIDPNVINTTLGTNLWQPQIVSNVPSPGIVHNGGMLNIVGVQNYPSLNAYNLYAGTGTFGSRPPVTAAGGGAPIENQGMNSEDPSQWTTSVTGTGSAVTFGNAVSIPGPFGNFIMAVPVTLTLGANGTTGYQAILSYPSRIALPNPHPVVGKMYVLPVSCPAAYTFVWDSQLNRLSCGGTYNGWTLLKMSHGSSSGTSSAIGLNLTATAASTYSTTMVVYVTYAQLSSNDGDYVKTTSQAVPLSYGLDPQDFAPADPYPINAPNGITDTSTSTRPACGTTVPGGTTFVEKGTGTAGADIVLHCTLTNATLKTYGWQVLYQIPQQAENQLLRSNAWNVSPNQLKQQGAALIPVVTTTSTFTDPYGNVNSPNIQQVVFNLNGGSTTNDISYMVQQPVGLPTPHNMHQEVWVSSASGTPIILWGNASGSPPTRFYTIPAYPTWLKLSADYTIGTSIDSWEMLLEGSLTASSATLYIYGACITRNSGACVSTTGVPTNTTTAIIDNTGNSPLLIAPGTTVPTSGANTFTGAQTAPIFSASQGLSGSGTPTYALGLTTVVGTGASTPVCTTNHVCDQFSGDVTMTTGTGTSGGGVPLTVTFPTTRTNAPNCIGRIENVTSSSDLSPFIATTTTALTYTYGAVLTASTTFRFIYICGGS